MDLPATVAPFILRGVTLAGVDSVYAPMERRVQAWSRLATLLSQDVLAANTETVSLEQAIGFAPKLLAGGGARPHRGGRRRIALRSRPLRCNRHGCSSCRA